MLTTSIKNANFYLLKHYPKIMKLEETYASSNISYFIKIKMCTKKYSKYMFKRVKINISILN
jgi:capsule polysaccharide export protein KpsE/RkpR